MRILRLQGFYVPKSKKNIKKQAMKRKAEWRESGTKAFEAIINREERTHYKNI